LAASHLQTNQSIVPTAGRGQFGLAGGGRCDTLEN
jgi:hypothetical protein